MKVKTVELQGAALDWAVAKCEGGKVRFETGVFLNQGDGYEYYSPTIDWAQGGPIIEREKFCAPTWDKLWQQWHCFHPKNAALGILGPTPLIAAMRCYVFSKLGDKVDVPEELT